MVQLAKITFWEGTYKTGAVGRAPQRPNHSLGQSSNVPKEYSLGVSSGPTFLRKSRELQCPAVGWAQTFCRQCGKNRSGEVSGLTLTRGTACECVRRPPIGRFQGSLDRMASSFSSLIRRSRWWLRMRCCQIPLCGNAQGVRADWFAPFGSRR